MDPALLTVVSGCGLGRGLIVAIGAQNAVVLRQGLRGEHVAAVVTVCAISDLVLIAGGVVGAGALLERMPGLADVTGWSGAAAGSVLWFTALGAGLVCCDPSSPGPGPGGHSTRSSPR